MGLLNKLIASVVSVITGLLGVGLLFAGGREATYGSDLVGGIIFLVGIVLLVFAAKA